MSERRRAIVIRARAATGADGAFSHPYNPKSEITGVQLGREAGLTRTGISLGRIAPGRESFVLHAHRYEEEWIYVLEGRGTLVSGGTEESIGPGDFVAFPIPSEPHHLRNDGSEPLTYLMGGENRPFDVVDFPEQSKVAAKTPEGFMVFDAANQKGWGEL